MFLFVDKQVSSACGPRERRWPKSSCRGPAPPASLVHMADFSLTCLAISRPRKLRSPPVSTSKTAREPVSKPVQSCKPDSCGTATKALAATGWSEPKSFEFPKAKGPRCWAGGTHATTPQRCSNLETHATYYLYTLEVPGSSIAWPSLRRSGHPRGATPYVAVKR